MCFFDMCLNASIWGLFLANSAYNVSWDVFYFSKDFFVFLHTDVGFFYVNGNINNVFVFSSVYPTLRHICLMSALNM
jgi:hypothetical protein